MRLGWGAAALAAQLVLAGAAHAAAADARMHALADSFLDGWLARRPHIATRLGVHRWDATLLPITQGTVAQDLAWLDDTRRHLDAIPRRELSFARAQEYDALRARLVRERVDLDAVRSWQHDPGIYLDLIAGGVQSLLERGAAPRCELARTLAGRLLAVPEVLRAAMVNLDQPPRIAVQSAIPRYEAVLALYRGPVAEVALGCKDTRVEGDLGEADSAAVHAVQAFVTFLRDEVLPRAPERFALGDSLYRLKLLADELEDTPLDALLARGRAELDATRARMDTLATAIAPGHTVQAVLDSLAEDRPAAPDSLVHFVAVRLNQVRAFLQTHDLLTLPERENLLVRETPAFRRGTSFASMDAPGPFETGSDAAYLDVAPAEPTWPADRIREHLSFYYHWATLNLVVHEALPGHYYQALARRGLASRLRQASATSSNVEGWAHYCERMMIEQGFGNGDPRAELAQLQAACQRLGRLIVGISLHTRGMTLDEGQQFFETHCLMNHANAGREALRGALDPTYGVYVLGKWRLLALRDEARARLGAAFTLRAFHDAVLREGPSPLPIVRAGVLHALLEPGHAAPAAHRSVRP